MGSSLATPTTNAPRHRSGDERLADYLHGEHNRRKLMNAIANALEMGGTTVLRLQSKPGSGEVFSHEFLHGGPLF